MKNTPLSELRKKSLQYFRKIGIVRGDGRRKKSIEYIVQKSYEALPKNLKKYVEDPEQVKTSVYDSIMASGSAGEIEPYNAIKQYAMDRKKKSGDNTKEYIYKRFRNTTLTFIVWGFLPRNGSKTTQSWNKMEVLLW